MWFVWFLGRIHACTSPHPLTFPASSSPHPPSTPLLPPPTPAAAAALVTYSTISSLTKKRDPFGGNVQNPKDFGGFLRNNDVPLPAPAKKVYIPSVRPEMT